MTKRHKSIQVAEYLVSGGAYFWAGYLVFALCWSKLGWSLWWAKLTSNIVGWSLNFILQRYWVFNADTLKHKQTAVTGRYAFITIVDFIMDYLIVAGLRQLGLTPYIGQFVSAGFFTIWNYFWYRFWVFPDKLDNKKFKLVYSRIFTHRAHGHSGV